MPNALTAESASERAGALRREMRFHQKEVLSHRKALRRKGEQLDALRAACARLGIKLVIETNNNERSQSANRGYPADRGHRRAAA